MDTRVEIIETNHNEIRSLNLVLHSFPVNEIIIKKINGQLISSSYKFNIQEVEDFYKQQFNYNIFNNTNFEECPDYWKQFILENLPSQERKDESFFYINPQRWYKCCLRLGVYIKSLNDGLFFYHEIPITARLHGKPGDVFVFSSITGHVFTIFNLLNFKSNKGKKLNIGISDIILEIPSQELDILNDHIEIAKIQSMIDFQKLYGDKYWGEDDCKTVPKIYWLSFYPLLDNQLITNLQTKALDYFLNKREQKSNKYNKKKEIGFWKNIEDKILYCTNKIKNTIVYCYQAIKNFCINSNTHIICGVLFIVTFILLLFILNKFSKEIIQTKNIKKKE